MATMKEVASRAGVSTATVSRVINQNGYVAPALQEKVRRTMEVLNYQPSALARGLRRQETQCVGVLVPKISQPFLASLLTRLNKRYSRKGTARFCAAPRRIRPKKRHTLRCCYANAPAVLSWYQPVAASPTWNDFCVRTFRWCWWTETCRTYKSIES